MIFAYDIVLIPPKEIIDQCIKINESIEDRKNIDFRKHGQLPHITLLMGGFQEKEVTKIQDELSEIIENLDPIEITLTSIHVGKFASGIEIEKSEALQNLHELIIERFSKYLRNEVNKEGVVGLPDVTEGTLRFINNYIDTSALENFDPHITIGDGVPKVNDSAFPMKFETKDLRVGRMGNYCTFLDEY